MSTPEFIRDLRADVGRRALWLPSVRGVVIRREDDAGAALGEPEVLLVRRSDDGAWTVTSGILEPGEQPAAGAVREIQEETGLIARPVRLAGVCATGLVTYANGDQCRFMDTVLEMEAVRGRPRVNDEESVDVGWFAITQLPAPIAEDQRVSIGWALDAGAPGRFFP